MDISRLPCYSGAGSGFLGALIISNYPLNLKLKCIGPSILRGLLIHSHCTWCLIVYGSAVSASHRPCLGTITLVHPNLNIHTPLLLLHSLRSHKYVEGFFVHISRPLAEWLYLSLFIHMFLVARRPELYISRVRICILRRPIKNVKMCPQ